MDVTRGAQGDIHLSHRRKIENLASLIQLCNCRKALVPISDDNLVDRQDAPLLSPADHHIYRSAVGSLLHISSFTRPDISYAVGRLARKVAAPTTNDRSALQQLVRYLWSSRELSLILSASGDNSLVASSDSTWGSTPRPHSITGVVFLIGSSPIYWTSKRHTLVGSSTCEAECDAASHAAHELTWGKNVYEEIFQLPSSAVSLEMDNKSAILTTQADGYTSRKRHYVMHHTYLRECVQRQILSPSYVPSSDMRADGFTKALALPKFREFVARLQLIAVV